MAKSVRRDGVSAQNAETPADRTQVGGSHYKGTAIQHWSFAWANDLDYFQGQITKYVTRWKKKNGLQDLEKARHFLDKYIELEQERGTAAREAEADAVASERLEDARANAAAEPQPEGYVNQDGPLRPVPYPRPLAGAGRPAP